MNLAFVDTGGEERAMAAADLLASEGIHVHHITRTRDAQPMIEKLLQMRSPIGLDIETTPLPAHVGRSDAGLDPHLSRIRLVQFYGGGETAYVVDLDRIDLDILAPLWTQSMVAHNAVFELKHLLKAGAVPKRLGCTMLQANALQGGLRALAEVASGRLGWKMSNGLETSDWSAPELSPEQLAYAALDAVAAHRLAAAQHEELTARDLLRTYRLMRDAQCAVARLELNGIYFDVNSHAALAEEWRTVAGKNADELARMMGPEVNPTSGQQVGGWLETNLDPDTLAGWPRTRTGQLRTSGRVIARHADHPLVGPLLAHREAATRLASFGPSFVAHVSPATGRIHASFSLGAAASGRMASYKPNLQNAPRDDAFRALFVAPRGRRLVVADYTQIELRVAALVSDDRAMLDAYARGADLHRLTASAIAGTSPEAVTSEQRRLAKAVNFGLLYGQGARGLAAYARSSYGVSMSEAQAGSARNAFFSTYPELAAWQRQTAQRAGDEPLVRTPAGRIFDFRRTSHGYSYTEALNIPIQGGAAEVLMAALSLLDEKLAGLDAKLVNVIHDELVLEVAVADAERCRAAVTETMSAGMRAIFPEATIDGLVEAHVGRSWAEAK